MIRLYLKFNLSDVRIIDPWFMPTQIIHHMTLSLI
jgi:hypothetical protein